MHGISYALSLEYIFPTWLSAQGMVVIHWYIEYIFTYIPTYTHITLYNAADIQWMNVMREPIDREQSTYYYDVRSVDIRSYLLLRYLYSTLSINHWMMNACWVLLVLTCVGERLRRCWTYVAGIYCVVVGTWSSTTVCGLGEWVAYIIDHPMQIAREQAMQYMRMTILCSDWTLSGRPTTVPKNWRWYLR